MTRKLNRALILRCLTFLLCAESTSGQSEERTASIEFGFGVGLTNAMRTEQSVFTSDLGYSFSALISHGVSDQLNLVWGIRYDRITYWGPQYRHVEYNYNPPATEHPDPFLSRNEIKRPTFGIPFLLEVNSKTGSPKSSFYIGLQPSLMDTWGYRVRVDTDEIVGSFNGESELSIASILGFGVTWMIKESEVSVGIDYRQDLADYYYPHSFLVKFGLKP